MSQKRKDTNVKDICNQFGHHAKSCENHMPSIAEPSSQVDGGSHATFNSTNYNSSTQSRYRILLFGNYLFCQCMQVFTIFMK